MTGRKRKLCRIWLAVVLATVLFIPFGAAVATNVGSKGSSSGGSYENEWHSNDLRDPVTGRRASFDTWSPYVGMHVGPGYILQMTDELKLDFYGKWFWTRIFKRKADVAGDTYNFDDIDYCRLRFGTRVDRNISEQNDIYAGVAWEHEFNGKAKAMTYGFDVPSPSVKGNTGIFDFGFSHKPKSVPGLYVDLGATAAVGVRHGIMGNMIVKYEF